MTFDWQDPLGVEVELAPELLKLRDSARSYAQQKLLPRILNAYREEFFDRTILKEMGELGFFDSALLDKSAHHATAYGLVAREIERVDSGYRSALSVQSSLVMLPLALFGTEAQKQGWLPGMRKGEIVGCFALSEAGGGSDPGAMQARARRDGTDWRLSGHKVWISNAPIADVCLVWAKDEDDAIRGFLVERGMAGLSTPKIEGKLSLRASTTGDVVLEDVRVPDANRLEVIGMKGPFSCLNMARYGIVWGVMGAAEACWHGARQFAMERILFGRPLAQTQLAQKKLADMQTHIALGLSAAAQLGRIIDSGVVWPEAISLLKRNNCATALKVAHTARDLLGANGICDTHHVIRHMMNLEAVSTYEGTADVHALVLGRAQTGLAAF